MVQVQTLEFWRTIVAYIINSYTYREIYKNKVLNEKIGCNIAERVQVDFVSSQGTRKSAKPVGHRRRLAHFGEWPQRKSKPQTRNSKRNPEQKNTTKSIAGWVFWVCVFFSEYKKRRGFGLVYGYRIVHRRPSF